MAALRSAQGVPEFVGSPDGDLGAVAGDDAVPLEPEVPSVEGFEALHPLMEQSSDEVRFNLHPGLAECGGRDWLPGGQGKVEGPTLVPEGVEQALVSPPTGIGYEEEEESDEDLRREGAASREVLLSPSKRAGIIAGKKLSD